MSIGYGEASYWTCVTCDIKMTPKDREPHLWGKRHAERLRILAQEEDTAELERNHPSNTREEEQQYFPRHSRWSDLFKTLPQNPSEPSSKTPVPFTEGQLWACSTYNLIVSAVDEELHLNSRRHIRGRLKAVGSENDFLTETASIPNAKINPRLALSGFPMIGDSLSDEYWFSAGEERIGRLEDRDQLPLIAAGNWACSTCNITMPTIDKESHLRKMIHAQNLENLEQQNTAAQTPSSSATETPKSFSEFLIAKGLQLDGRGSLKGGKPIEKSGAEGQEGTEDTEDTGPSFTIGLKWTCSTCNLTIPAVNQDSHLSGKRHAKNLATFNPQNTITSTTPSIPITETPTSFSEFLVAKGLQLDGRGIVRSGRTTEAFVSEEPDQSSFITIQDWTCPLCNLTISIHDRERHLNGQLHKGNLASDQEAPKRIVTINKIWKCTTCSLTITDESKKAHRKSVSHKAWVRQRAEEYEEGMELLRDIDTQWGTIPEGGAYNLF